MALSEWQTRTLWGGVYAVALIFFAWYSALSFLLFSLVGAFYIQREVRALALPGPMRWGIVLYAIVGMYMGHQLGLDSITKEWHYERVLVPLLFIWTSDSFAYLGGKWWGKTPLAPRISPKKTREGALVGFLCTLLVAVGISRLWPNWSAQIPTLIAGMAIAFAAPAGDLVQSYWKRRAGVKDSGIFLPGHGGWFDRLDSYLLVAWVLGLLRMIYSL